LIHVPNSQYRAVFILQQTAIWTGRGIHSPIHSAGEEHPDLRDRVLLPETSSVTIHNQHPEMIAVLMRTGHAP
jgi:hypothetical protein